MKPPVVTMRRVTASPGFVPHEMWDRFAWLLPHEQRQEPWYYAAVLGEEPSARGLPTDPNFLKTVDPALRSLVSWLHQHGIPTGPSCAGHKITTDVFEDIYAELERDAEVIQTTGLLLRDPETGEDYVFQDRDYELPWRSFKEFQQKANAHQPIGWLPFYTTDPRIGLALGTRHGFEIKETGDNAYGVKTTGENPDAWDDVFAVLRQTFS